MSSFKLVPMEWFKSMPKFSYRKVPKVVDGSEEGEDIDDSEKALMGEEAHKFANVRRSRSRSSYLHWTVHLISLVLAGLWLASHQGILISSNLQSIIHVPGPSLSVLSKSFDHVRFNGTVRGRSPYMGPPTPEAIEAWERMIRVGNINITREEMIKMGKSLDSAQFPAEYGGGYMGLLEGAHNLHCLYSLWEDHYLHIDPSLLPHAVKEHEELGPERVEIHFNHCLDMLRQQILCTPSTDIITFNWVKGKPAPVPNFNTMHTCQAGNPNAVAALGLSNYEGGNTGMTGYEALLNWNQERIVDSPPGRDGYDWTIPADAVILPTDP